MFDPKKLMDMMQQATQMQKEMQDSLKGVTVHGAAGGGMIQVDMNGEFEILKLKIDPSVVNPNEVEFLEDLVRAGVSDAIKQARDVWAGQMKSMSGKLGF